MIQKTCCNTNKVHYNLSGEAKSRISILTRVEMQPATSYMRLEPSRGWVSLKLRELWEYRELLYFLTWRDIKVRYKQTVLGAAWAIIQPLMTMVVFTLFFGGLAGIPSDGIPYPVFSYTALVPWTFFATGLGASSNSLVGSSNLIKKVYFPRLVIPIATVFSGVVDFILAFGVLLILMAFYVLLPQAEVLWADPLVFQSMEWNTVNINLTANVIFLPFFLLLALITSLAVGLWLSAMNVQFRDIRYTIPFITQFWLFITPIAYPSSLIENDALRLIYGINPMAGVVEGFRWALLGTNTQPGPIILVSTTIAVLLMVSGLYYFRRMEKTFADVV
jgi:lipopolysaccharide transport system permease protein